MQYNFLLLKLNMPNENIFLFLQKLKGNDSIREENNAYFDTSLATVTKSDESHCCKKKFILSCIIHQSTNQNCIYRLPSSHFLVNQ